MSKKDSNRSETDSKRREFIRKAVWTAPTLITLATLGATRKAAAQSDDCDPFLEDCNAPSLEQSFREEPDSGTKTELEKLA